jgi:hypothetical protein
MTPKDYEYLLVAADLANFHKRWGFSIKMMKLKLFLEGHWFTTISCDGTFDSTMMARGSRATCGRMTVTGNTATWHKDGDAWHNNGDGQHDNG